MTDSNDSRPRRPRLRAHCIAPLPAAALGLGFAASSLAGTSAPVDAVDDHFDVVVRARADGQPVPAGNVLANDSGGQAALVAQSASYIFGGLRVTLAPDGALSTQLLNACNVSDGPVPYTATDTVSTDSANAFFHFLPPVAADAYSTPIDQVLLGDIGTNDPFHGDPNYNVLSYVLVGQGHLGNVNLQLNGQFGYTPQGGNSGHDQFLYQLVNKDACSNVVYQVDVDVFPAPRPDDYYTQYLVPVSANLLANDLGNALSVVGYSQPDHGSVNVASNGDFSYQSAAGFSGEDAFSYTVQDQDGLNAVAMVTITVEDASPIAVDDDVTVVTGQHATGNVIANDSDPNGDALTLVFHHDPTHGSLSIDANGIFDYVSAAGFSGQDYFDYSVRDPSGWISNAVVSLHVLPLAQPDAFVTAYATPVAGQVLGNDVGTGLAAAVTTGAQHGVLNFAPDGSFSYQPNAGFSGSDGFTYAVTDASGQNASADVSITVGNATPLANADSASVVSGASVGGNVLANDSDPNGDSLSVTSHTDPAHGSLVVNGDGSFTYGSTSGYSGSDSFSYVAADGHGANASASVTITVQPKATPDSFSTAYDTALSGNVLGNDLGSNLQANLVSDVLHGSLALYADGHFDYTPGSGYSGTDQFTYIVHDGAGQNAVAAVNITVGNGNPVANPDSVSVVAGQSASGNVLGNDSDPNGDTLAVASSTAPAHGTASVQGDGAFTYAPAAGYSGNDSFQYVLSDGHGGNAIGTVSVLVTPVATSDTFATGYQGPVSGNVLGNDLGSGLNVTLVTPPQHGNLVLLPDGSFTYTPAPGYRGPDGFDYLITDSANSSASAHVSFAVAGPQAGPASVPTLDPRWMTLLAGALGWLGWRRRPRDD